jgi:hypothetical protein
MKISRLVRFGSTPEICAYCSVVRVEQATVGVGVTTTEDVVESEVDEEESPEEHDVESIATARTATQRPRTFTPGRWRRREKAVLMTASGTGTDQ